MIFITLNEVEKTFYDDVREKKSTGYGAYHKINGSKSKKCMLPSDYMSKKEKEKMNGEVKTYNLKAPVTYDEFIIWPDDIKRKYLEYIITEFKPGDKRIAEMMGCSDRTIYVTRRMLKIGVTRNPHAFNKEGWEAFLSGNKNDIQEEITSEPTIEEIQSEPCSEEVKDILTNYLGINFAVEEKEEETKEVMDIPKPVASSVISNVDITFNSNDWESIVNFIKQIDISSGARVEIKVSVNES